MTLLEVVVEDVAGISAAVEGGADRLELCAALALGGLTPPLSLIAEAAAAPIPVHLLARPRDGNFRYSAAEAALVAADITATAEAGLAGLVIGASRSDGRLDTDLLSAWIGHARAAASKRGKPLALTLHRAFDLCPDQIEAMETAIELGFDRILTSAGEPRVADALPSLGRLVGAAGDRIVVMAGSGVDAACLPAILETGVREVHASCRVPLDDAGAAEQRFRFQSGPRQVTSADTVARMKSILAA
ncbi:copper homeostasis protein CutC [Sphingosinicella sp. BN140058]|uniref:copper homeostasis protein CutC n=1 Tax=Sphingosinicella sp. BN140058 TaxID=1892855 RepID=UPI001012E87D|nr:copper homeostasis protein CutC [Sphingosinicella sp. BN140058]QAY78734.1 copper homeostasis protein CutC [Sphingosinicella sp. BN140058]